jgi:hypothetical protein
MANKVLPEDIVQEFEFESDSDEEEKSSNHKQTTNRKKENEFVDHFLYQNVQDRVVDDIEEYIRWHKAHPRASTPRKARGNVEASIQAGTTVRCEHNPNMVYTQLPIKPKAIEPVFQPKQLGKNAEFAVVNATAHSYEHNLRLDQRDDFDDPWWNKSVKDQIYVHHLPEDIDDGSWLDPNEVVMPVNFAMEEMKRREEERERKRQQRLDEVAISKQFGKPERVKVSAWEDQFERTIYTEDGKEALKQYTKKNLEAELTKALEEFDDPSRGGAFAKKGGGGMNKKARELHNTLTKYKTDLGGDEEVEKMSENFIKFASKHRNAVKSSTGGSVFDLGMDFLDACVKVNATKAVPMLIFGADANTVTEDEEPVFVMLLNKVRVFCDVCIASSTSYRC